jgi:hypothetical protein
MKEGHFEKLPDEKEAASRTQYEAGTNNIEKKEDK